MSTRNLYNHSKHISSQQRKYVYGGGHGQKLKTIVPSQGLDCSSSTSLALYRAGLYPDNLHRALVSWEFNRWGIPGKGNHHTVWYNGSHVWIEFYEMGAYQRFDTSPWGFGRRGPRVRKTWRPHVGFKARHWPGH